MSSPTKKRSLPGVQRTDAFLFAPEALQLIEDEAHPLYDARVKLPIDEGLVRNIMVHGVIKPVVVQTGTEPPTVVDGRQRVKAAREANRRLTAEGKEPIRVMAVRRRGEDGDLYGVLVSANEHSQSDGPIEKARKAQRLLNLGKTDEEVCVAFGWKPSALKGHLKLLEVSAPVRRAVEAGELSVSAAGLLSSLPATEQVEAVKKLVAEGKPTVKKAAVAAGGKAKTAPGKVRVKRTLKALEGMKGKEANWFYIGASWATGEATDEDVKQSGLELPDVE